MPIFSYLVILPFLSFHLAKSQYFPYGDLHSKTAYRDLIRSSAEDDKIVQFPVDCAPIYVDGFFRHGTRAPSKKYNKKFTALHDKILKSDIDSNVYPGFKEWISPFTKYPPNQLLDEGKRELSNLGDYYSKLFAQLHFNPQNTEWISSNVSRTNDSANAFRLKALGVNKPITSWIKLAPEMRYYKTCKRYIQEVKDNESALKEYNKFRTSKEMKNVLKLLKPLTADDLLLMFTACGHEHAANVTGDPQATSVWCKILPKPAVPVLNYWSDIKNYWTKAGGYKINYLPACGFLAGVIRDMKNAVEQYRNRKQVVPVGRFRFGHEGLLYRLLSLLELYDQSTPLTGDAIQKDRGFKASRLSPFASNLGLAILKCKNSGEALRLLPLFNQHRAPVDWKMCAVDRDGTCSLEKFFKSFKFCLKEENQPENLCQLNSTSATRRSFFMILFSAIFVTVILY